MALGTVPVVSFMNVLLVTWFLHFAVILASGGQQAVATRQTECAADAHNTNDAIQRKHSSPVLLVKVGGSSITDKAKRETLNETAIEWLSKTLASAMKQRHDDNGKSFVLVHGAGSFGHVTASQFGLSSHESKAPSPLLSKNELATLRNETAMEGLAKTRLSVQSLNHQVVSSLIRHRINAVGVSPCFGIPGLQAHGGEELTRHLVTIVNDCIQAGLLPVIHGDACLYGLTGAGILGGDTIMEALGTSGMAQEAIFLTDVDGVYTADPRIDAEAQLLRSIDVDASGQVLTSLEASGSRHAHDVTGGLEAKLGAAASIAASGTDVLIVKCATRAAAQVLQGDELLEPGTLVKRLD